MPTGTAMFDDFTNAGTKPSEVTTPAGIGTDTDGTGVKAAAVTVANGTAIDDDLVTDGATAATDTVATGTLIVALTEPTAASRPEATTGAAG